MEGHYLKSHVLHLTYMRVKDQLIFMLLLLLLCIYTQRNIAIYYRTQNAIKPIRLYRYSPNSQVTHIPLTGR